jgi:hypothetical protein
MAREKATITRPVIDAARRRADAEAYLRTPPDEIPPAPANPYGTWLDLTDDTDWETLYTDDRRR